MDAPVIVGPSSNFFISQRLRLHYVDWGPEGAPPLVLVHGGRDHARSWDPTARALRGDWRVAAPDLRGHGDSAWAIGGLYSLPELVLDLAQLVEALGAEQVTLIGHSLGGAVVLRYAGTFPERVRKVVAIEGLGPPPDMIARMRKRSASERLREWIGTMRGLAGRSPRRYASIDEAAKRMQEVNPHLSPELARHLTVHGVARNEDGSFSWKFDNYVRAFGPARYDEEEVRATWAEIAAPTLLIYGSESFARDPRRDGRIEPFRDARVERVEGAGHWVHHDQAEVFLELVRGFL